MCRCSDKICAETTMQEYAAWKKAQREAARAMAKSDRKVLGDLERELKACRKKLLGGGENAEPEADDDTGGGSAPEAPAAR
jgi:hypothetical protein